MLNLALHGFFAFLLTALPTAYAADSAKAETDQATVELISEKEAAAPGATQWIGILFKPKAGWHVYWKNPGDSGLPPRVEFASTPSDSKFGALEFPTPSRIPYGPLINFGYEGDVLYPAEWTAPESLKAGENVVVTANLKWLICKTECVPGRAQLSLRLPVETRERFASVRGTHSALFQSTVAALPTAETSEVRLALVDAEGGKDHVEIVYSGKLNKSAISSVFFFPEGESGIASDAKPKVSISPEGLRVLVPRKEKKAVGEIRGVLKIGENRSISVSEVINPALLTKSSTSKGDLKTVQSPVDASLGWMLLFAFIGGLILNLMPCILPVLSIKVMEIASQAGSRTRDVRLHGLVYTFGILISFWVLAAILLSLRAGGTTLGWGFQLQSPTFIAVLALLFFVMGLNLFGFFELGGRLMGVGSGLASREGYFGSFFTGVLTTVAATPCSAPFMGTALGFALTQPALVATLVLTMLGLGLAFPYLVFSYLPSVSRILPRPGMWMKTMKEFLAFPLFATVAWLLKVLGNQAGNTAVFYVLSALVVITAGIWFLGWQSKKQGVRWFARILGVLCLLLVTFLLKDLEKMRSRAALTPSTKSPLVQEPWKEWSPELLEKSLNEKRTVLVNLTADWCVTCKVNEAVVFKREAVRQALASEGVIGLVGDWTNGDPRITDYLMKNGRNSVPVYLLYSRGSREPKILPQILSVDMLLRELR